MYEITYSIDGIIKNITLLALSQMDAVNIFTNMYGSGTVQIIRCIRKWKMLLEIFNESEVK